MARDRLIEALAQEFPGALQEAGGRALFLPHSEDELSEALRIATRIGAPLSAPGGGHRDESVIIDLRRMADLLAFDATSHLAHIEAGCPVAEVEATLLGRGLTLGLASAPEEPIGTWLANGAAGARDRSSDPVDQLVAGLSAVLADGRRLHIRPAPRRAAGPDLIAAFIGGRGRLGVITSVHLVARPATDITPVAFHFDDQNDAAAALAWMRGRGVRPVRSEIRVENDRGAILALQLDGPERLRAVKLAVARQVADERGGVLVENAPAPRGAAPIPHSESIDALGAALDPSRILG
ncbi:MAG: hypothetical protein DRJ42_02195 [Deltaproteobacteria bacterium]|nr:MAG: hypothetical protein DRJ42_02195 [Deltaproteobacteria bacterium]